MESAITHLGRRLAALQGETEGVENSGVVWTCTMLAAFLIAVTKHIIEQLQLGRVMAAHGGYSPGSHSQGSGYFPLGGGRPGTGTSSHHIGTCGAEGKHSVLSWLPWFLFFSV